MALSVDFQVQPELREAFAAFKAAGSTDRAILASVEKETLHFIQAVNGTASESVDTSKVRSAISALPSQACFIVFRRSDGTFALITYISETAKPKDKMMYSASAAHLRKEFNAHFSRDKRISSADEMSPGLFGHEETDKQELMSESEKQAAALAKLYADEVATSGPPVPRALPGMGATLDEAADTAVLALAAATGDANVAVLIGFDPTAAVASTKLTLVKSISEGDRHAIAATVVGSLNLSPCFVLARRSATNPAGETKTGVVFVYYCPMSAKPKEKMRYSATKSNVIAHIKSLNITIVRSVEIDESERFVAAVDEAIVGVDNTCFDEAPAPAAAAGDAKVSGGVRLPGMAKPGAA